jgi:putative ABC transport system permease protein
MYFKLSLRNVKRSISDYYIYFSTLIFGICIFYMLNLAFSKEVIIKLTVVQHSYMKLYSGDISICSICIAFLLAFLIIYANNFMIKRRKKEFGIYMTLGMSKRGISSILLCETFIIGLISLIVGLFLGIVLSQALQALISKALMGDVPKYRLQISESAIFKTIVYFTVTFILTSFFNFISILKCKIIYLINDLKKNQEVKQQNTYISIFLFLISILCLEFSYRTLLSYKALIPSKEYLSAIILTIVGTFLFFMSLSRLLLKLMILNKKLYLKKLNVFIFRQLNSKINTISASISMSVICLMISFSMILVAITRGWNLKPIYEFPVQVVCMFIYASMIFMITASAIIALKQLSEATEDIKRYKILRKMGVDIKTIDRSIFWSVFIYFMLPLALAIVHSIVAITFWCNIVAPCNQDNIYRTCIQSSMVVCLIYIGYFIATYLGYKKILTSSL